MQPKEHTMAVIETMKDVGILIQKIDNMEPAAGQ
jgi:hypothetical protein